MHFARPAPPRTTRATVRCGSSLSPPVTSLAAALTAARVAEPASRPAGKQQETPMKRLAIAALIAVSAFPVLRAQQAVPEIPFDSVPNALKLPADLNFGEDAG